MDHLQERRVCFEHVYNFMCERCRGITTVSSDDYHDEVNEAHIDCAHCGAKIHFGPAVLSLRDPTDPALDDYCVVRSAWYHTSTDTRWPNGSRTLSLNDDNPLAQMLPAEALHQARDRFETQALHLGTYEAAIESMLRRMRDQDDGGSQFYLYRVQIRDGLVIEPGWRDENHAPAAQITQPELGHVDAIRYLNVHEAVGSISLAVRRQAIQATQCVSLPVATVQLNLRQSAREIADIRAQYRRLEAQRSPTLDRLDQLRADAAHRRGLAFVRSPSPEQQALLDKIDQTLEDTYLSGVSRPIRSAFTNALHAWRKAQSIDTDDEAYIRRFATFAAVITNPELVHQMLASKPALRSTPWRP